MPDAKQMKRRSLQFSLRSLILLILVFAVGLSFWRQWQVHAKLTAKIEELDETKVESQHLRQLKAVFRGIDIENPEHLKALKSLQRLSYFFSDVTYQNIARDGIILEVAIFKQSIIMHPGAVDSVVVLFQDGEFLDIVHRSSWTRTEEHEVKLEDANQDDEIDLVIDCKPLGWRHVQKPFKIIYKITPLGFKAFRPPQKIGDIDSSTKESPIASSK